MRYWQKARQIDKWNRIESRNSARPVWTTDFMTRCKGNTVGKVHNFQQIVLEELISKCKKKKKNASIQASYHIQNLKWIIDLI